MFKHTTRFVQRRCDLPQCGSEPGVRGGCRECHGVGYVSVATRHLNPHDRDELITFLLWEAGDLIHEERYPFDVEAERVPLGVA